MGLFSDAQNYGLSMRLECWERFSRHRLQSRAVMHVGIAKPRWRGKRSRHSQSMRNPQFCVSGKRPMYVLRTDAQWCWVIWLLAPWSFEWNFRIVIFKLIDGWCIPFEIAPIWIQLHLINVKSTWVQIMAWCHQATSYYLHHLFIVYIHFGTSCLFYRMADFKFTYWHILSFLPHVIIVIMNVIFVLFYCMLCQKWRNKDVQSINLSHYGVIRPLWLKTNIFFLLQINIWVTHDLENKQTKNKQTNKHRQASTHTRTHA